MFLSRGEEKGLIVKDPLNFRDPDMLTIGWKIGFFIGNDEIQIFLPMVFQFQIESHVIGPTSRMHSPAY